MSRIGDIRTHITVHIHCLDICVCVLISSQVDSYKYMRKLKTRAIAVQRLQLLLSVADRVFIRAISLHFHFT